jgi:hypothetical protein
MCTRSKYIHHIHAAVIGPPRLLVLHRGSCDTWRILLNLSKDENTGLIALAPSRDRWSSAGCLTCSKLHWQRNHSVLRLWNCLCTTDDDQVECDSNTMHFLNKGKREARLLLQETNFLTRAETI